VTPTGVAALFCATGQASGSLLDIRDPRGFVAATIQKSRVRLSSDEHEDLLCEGLAILCDLASRFEPHRPGYNTPGRFSGYAAKYLPLRLQDAYGKLKPTVTRRDPDGQRVREYVTHLSISADRDNNPSADRGRGTHHTLVATYGLVGEDAGYPLIEAAMDLLEDPRLHRRVLAGIDRGMGTDEIARTLGIRRPDVIRLRTEAMRAIAEVRGKPL
jgi:hypothetical protein